MHVYLIGFMGAGKSTVGPFLAALMDRPFVDLDNLIEKHADRSIAEIFESEGEKAFRRYETDALRGLGDSPPAVVALGGGAITVFENREHMRAHGKTVWLDVPFEILFDRLAETGRETRPLFADVSSVRKLYDERLADYRRSDHRIDVSSEDDAPTVARVIFEQLKERE